MSVCHDVVASGCGFDYITMNDLVMCSGACQSTGQMSGFVHFKMGCTFDFYHKDTHMEI